MIEQTAVELPRPHLRKDVLARLGLLGAVLFVEKLLLESLVDDKRAQAAQGLGAAVRYAQHWGFRYLVTFLAAVMLFAFVGAQKTLQAGDNTRDVPNPNPYWILVHAVFLAALAPLSYFLYRGNVDSMGFAALAVGWVLICAVAVAAAGVGLISSSVWMLWIRSMGIGWVYAALVALAATVAWIASEQLWDLTASLTFVLVKWALMPILSGLAVDAASRIIVAPHFAIEVSEVCSGLEGIGLMLAFSTAWLLYFRREYIFPRALVLIPISVVAIFGLNAIRIAVLLLIGNAGFPEVALYGFHSQAGWIAFNAVACAMVYFSRSSAWWNRSTSATADPSANHNPTAIYLIPLLSLLFAGTVSHALSGRFETFYPLRFFVGAATLFILRRSLVQMTWRCSWRALALGGGMFLLWLGFARWLAPAMPVPASLTGAQPYERAVWIACHCLTSVVLVPIAEELAYRGYLMRRLESPDFELVRYGSVGWVALLLTAIAFGAAHGTMWMPGILAGLSYGSLAIRRDSLGEAVVAHATTNGLVAMTVIAGNQWQLW